MEFHQLFKLIRVLVEFSNSWTIKSIRKRKQNHIYIVTSHELFFLLLNKLIYTETKLISSLTDVVHKEDGPSHGIYYHFTKQIY